MKPSDSDIRLIELLKGKEFGFYGVDGHCFKLDDKVFEAMEDEDDGYRSYLDCVVLRDVSGKIFFDAPLCKVRIGHSASYDDGFALYDVDTNDLILDVGTDNMDDYYPWFCFDYLLPGLHREVEMNKLKTDSKLADFLVFVEKDTIN